MLTADAKGEETIHVMSEVGVTKILNLFAGDAAPGADASMKLIDSGRIGPGEMISVDLKAGKFSLNDDVKKRMAQKKPYAKWLADSVVVLPAKPFYKEVVDFANTFVTDPGVRSLAISKVGDGDYFSAVTDDVDDGRLITTQTAFGWGTEDVEVQISSMAGAYCAQHHTPPRLFSLVVLFCH